MFTGPFRYRHKVACDCPEAENTRRSYVHRVAGWRWLRAQTGSEPRNSCLKIRSQHVIPAFSVSGIPHIVFVQGTHRQVPIQSATSGRRVPHITGGHSLRNSAYWVPSGYSDGLRTHGVSREDMRIEGGPCPKSWMKQCVPCGVLNFGEIRARRSSAGRQDTAYAKRVLGMTGTDTPRLDTEGGFAAQASMEFRSRIPRGLRPIAAVAG
jgi:hypothetical protein